MYLLINIRCDGELKETKELLGLFDKLFYSEKQFEGGKYFFELLSKVREFRCEVDLNSKECFFDIASKAAKYGVILEEVAPNADWVDSVAYYWTSGKYGLKRHLSNGNEEHLIINLKDLKLEKMTFGSEYQFIVTMMLENNVKVFNAKEIKELRNKKDKSKSIIKKFFLKLINFLKLV